MALLLIGLELEVTLKEALEALHHPFSGLPTLHQNDEESRPAELPRQPLAEPDVNLSAHPAPIIQP
jgi:hypothetical protein